MDTSMILQGVSWDPSKASDKANIWNNLKNLELAINCRSCYHQEGPESEWFFREQNHRICEIIQKHLSKLRIIWNRGPPKSGRQAESPSGFENYGPGITQILQTRGWRETVKRASAEDTRGDFKRSFCWEMRSAPWRFVFVKRYIII